MRWRESSMLLGVLVGFCLCFVHIWMIQLLIEKVFLVQRFLYLAGHCSSLRRSWMNFLLVQCLNNSIIRSFQTNRHVGHELKKAFSKDYFRAFFDIKKLSLWRHKWTVPQIIFSFYFSCKTWILIWFSTKSASLANFSWRIICLSAYQFFMVQQIHCRTFLLPEHQITGLCNFYWLFDFHCECVNKIFSLTCAGALFRNVNQ